MAVNANALTTLAMARTYLKVPTATVDAALDTMIEFFINASSEYIEKETDRKLKSQSITELQHGRKSNLLLLKQWPVTAITSLHIDAQGVYGSDTLIDAAEYRIADDSNSLLLMDQIFPNGYNNIKVVYTAGFASVPTDLEHACLWLVTWYDSLRNNKDIGRPQKSKGDESFQISQSAPKDVIDAITRYKRTEMPGANALVFNT